MAALSMQVNIAVNNDHNYCAAKETNQWKWNLTSIIYKAQKLELDVHSESKPGRGVCFREATNSGERSV